MNLTDDQIIERTVTFVKTTLADAEGGHDWWHIARVWANSKVIAQAEVVDMLVVNLAALLHDIADSKFHDGDEEIGPQTATSFLNSIDVSEEVIQHVINIIRYISFKSGFDRQIFSSKELEVVQDADRLDALGAIGIARTFNYGGFKERTLYDPEIKPDLKMNKEQYKSSTAPTINHFYEKLLLLKDKMNTTKGKELAEKRHAFLEQYLEQFFMEWNAES